ncbi:arginine-glutamic acid dipeptide repeats protein-like [Plodia interpunctella]|uniref:arginine-glutamic acid dipeptide repeats protein-like n=1 Tax=Plodia interpunctella TaxID=58824 RepID=UPI0023683E91|nr:arginine-glutamic acid dipeptide repeats protein-like [Plodia interpunctella]
MIHNSKENKNKSALSTRWAQMSKQEQIIEKKKIEIQAKLEAQKQAAALAAQAKLSITKPQDDNKGNIFSNDGSFMSQFKALLDKQKKEKEVAEEQLKDKVASEAKKREQNIKLEDVKYAQDNRYEEGHIALSEDRRRSGEKGNRERHRRWSDRSRNRPHSPMTPVIEDRKKPLDNKIIPPLMQIPICPSEDQNSDSGHQWQGDNSEDADSNPELPPNNMMGGPGMMGPRPMGPGPMAPGPMGPGPMGPSTMGPGPMGPGQMGAGQMGPNPIGPGPIGPGPMGPGSMGPGPMGPGPMGPNPMGSGTMGSGPMGPGPMGPGLMGPGPMGPRPMGPGIHMGLRPGMGPGPGGPPFMCPPNFTMPPNFMGPSGTGGPCGPGPMSSNMCAPGGSNNSVPGPNGPAPPFFGPPFQNPPMIGPPNSMMSNNNGNMPFGAPTPPFGPNGSNFGLNGPNMNNQSQNMSFLPTTSNSSIPLHSNSEPKPVDAGSIRPTEPMKLQSIPPPMPLPLNNIPKPKDMDPGNIPVPSNSLQVLSTDIPPAVQRAAAEVATNGDHWENVLKAIHSQDQNMWFLHNTNSNEYKAFRELVRKMRDDGEHKHEVKPEDKYEPEFSLEDDDSSDSRPYFKEEKSHSYNDSNSQPRWNMGVKREQASSQSDEEPEAKKERRRKKKSRWGDDPPADIKPPRLVFPPPPPPPVITPGVQLAKIDEEGLKLTTMNRNNHALMQYAMTNYGTTNLSPEDWKKCEDNFKLNLLYQDMLKKRQEVERLAYAGKHKYEYDSDEDTSDGTWEHKLRAKEMTATERWATELTKQAAGKHHIGDFLPPEELKKFMEKYSAVKSGKEPDLSDYKEFKLKEDNVGFKMLQKLGWNEGQGLGAEGTGIVEPINKAQQPLSTLGLGADAADGVAADDDEFDAYRKRMMLAYRFRPNPLNNPRRPYY